MRKNLFLALLLTPLSLFAQTEVLPYTPGINAEGVTYILPRTVLRIDVLVEKKHYTPGEFAKYAERYLHVKNVEMEPSTTCTIKELHLDIVGKPDMNKIYTIRLKDKTSAPLIKLNEDGILLAINTEPQPSTPFSGYKTTKSGTVYNSRNYMTEEILMAGSTAKMAELCAQEIYNIRESKNSLNRGQADFMPTDGKQMEIMVNNLNEQEEALLQLFTGSTVTETVAQTYYIDPQDEVQQKILFRFSRRLGIVAEDDLAGAPVYLKIKKETQLPDAAGEEKKKKLEGVVYNIPGKAKVEVTSAQETLLSASIAFGQFGDTDVLSRNLFNKKMNINVLFYDQTGGLRSVNTQE